MLPNEKYKRPKPPVAFTPERKAQFLEYFRYNPLFKGSRTLSCEAVGVSLASFYDHLKLDHEFAEAFKEALEGFIDENMYQPALRRAAEGIEEPVLGGKFRDEVVTTKRVYSDSLMLAMLRAHRAEFRDKEQAAGASGAGGGGVMIVPAAPSNVGDWESGFGELAQGNTGKETAK